MFDKMQDDASNTLRRIEKYRDCLRSGTCGAPAKLIERWVRTERVFDREGWIF